MELAYRLALAVAVLILITFESYLHYAHRYGSGRDSKHNHFALLKNAASESLTSPPECENILETMTRGRWVRKVDLNQYADQIEAIIKQEEIQVAELKKFRMDRGIQSASWREDFRCGYMNFQTQPPDTAWPKVGSWCDPKGERPCCSNNFTGTCMPPSEETCNCPGCVDLRTYKYAESSDWIVDDKNCKWRNYTASQICDVIEQSPFQDIYYVGDSFMRKMFKTLSIMITDDFEYGAMGVSTPPELKKLCKNMQQYYWRECREILKDISHVYHPDTLCGGRGYMTFTVQSKTFYSTDYKWQFRQFVQSKLGVAGSLIIVGVGFHMSCDSEIVINQYLGPAVDVITKRYGPPTTPPHGKLSGRWPQIIFCLPPTIGLLKSIQHLSVQSPERCNKFSSDMKAYGKQHDIKVMDWRLITKFIHSFDGVHHTLGVNRLKNLILLNYIASLEA